MDDDRLELDGWPLDQKVFLTLDLECDYGTAIEPNFYQAANEIDHLIRVLEKHDVALTCFLQTEILDTIPEAVTSLEDSSVPVNFHAHSHTHPKREDADVNFEISESISRVRDRFDNEVLGYRFPDGAAKSSDYKLLSENGIKFNASLFPSWRPGRFNNLVEPVYPYLHVPSKVIEIPFTVCSNKIRVPVTLSYLKLLGKPLETVVFRNPPRVIVFDLHMHDLVVPDTFAELPPAYRALYSRHKNSGVKILNRFIKKMLSKEYDFGVINDLYEASRASLNGINKEE